MLSSAPPRNQPSQVTRAARMTSGTNTADSRSAKAWCKAGSRARGAELRHVEKSCEVA